MDIRYLEILLKRQNLYDEDLDALIAILEAKRSCNRGTQIVLNYCREQGITHDAWGFFGHHEGSTADLLAELGVDWEYIEEELKR